MENQIFENRISGSKVFEALCKYQRMGLIAIPCKGKKPILQNWQKRVSPPSDDEIKEWIKTGADLNIGIVLGSEVGIIGVDIDGKEALNRFRELCGGELPATWTFKTPGSDVGMRMLFKISQGISAKKWVESFKGEHSELAFLGDGQQTIMPPSIHPNGKSYMWLKGKTPTDLALAEVPTFMLELMSSKKVNKPTAKKEKAIISSVPTDAILNRLAHRCQCFNESLVQQKAGKLSEEEWFRWVCLLVNAGYFDVATAFSQLSSKHDARSDERIQLLIQKVGSEGGPMTRCTTFGCASSDVERCFLSINESEEGDITNSPGAFIKNMDAPLPPTDVAYAPYINALQNSPEYIIDEYGHLCYLDRKKNVVKIGNFVARPVLEVVRDDGVEEKRTFRMEGIQAVGKRLPAIEVSATDFKRMNWITEKWGIGPSIKPGFNIQDICRDAIQNMGQDIIQEKIYTHMGWRKLPNGKWAFLHSGGSIGSKNISVELERALQKYRMDNACNELQKAARASLKLLTVAPLEITIPLLALVYLSVLCEALRKAGIEPTFILWLFGGTGTRKTSLGMLFLSHFGKFGIKSPPASFKDTANALEGKAFAAKDVLLLIDDYHPSASSYEAQKMAQVAQRVLRMYGDRIGRSRMKANTDFQKEYPPRGMALVTGEDTPKGQSSVARFLGVEILAGQVDLERLSLAQSEASLLLESMSGYIEWLLPQMDELPENLLELFHEKRSEFQMKSSHGRSGEAAAWLHIGFHMMLQYMINVGACNTQQSSNLLGTADEVFTKLISDQNTLVEEEKPVEVFVKVLASLMLSKKIRVDQLLTTSQGNLYDLSIGEMIGWQDEEYYYLLPDITYNVISRFLAAKGDRLSVTERTLWKHLDEAKLIRVEKGSDGRVQRSSKLPQKYKVNKDTVKTERPRVLWLQKAAFQQYEECS